eukprot:scaffold385_cov305-Pinguiococcus_pyrenoidosus.AAC.44
MDSTSFMERQLILAPNLLPPSPSVFLPSSGEQFAADSEAIAETFHKARTARGTDEDIIIVHSRSLLQGSDQEGADDSSAAYETDRRRSLAFWNVTTFCTRVLRLLTTKRKGDAASE